MTGSITFALFIAIAAVFPTTYYVHAMAPKKDEIVWPYRGKVVTDSIRRKCKRRCLGSITTHIEACYLIKNKLYDFYMEEFTCHEQQCRAVVEGAQLHSMGKCPTTFSRMRDKLTAKPQPAHNPNTHVTSYPRVNLGNPKPPAPHSSLDFQPVVFVNERSSPSYSMRGSPEHGHFQGSTSTGPSSDNPGITGGAGSSSNQPWPSSPSHTPGLDFVLPHIIPRVPSPSNIPGRTTWDAPKPRSKSRFCCNCDSPGATSPSCCSSVSCPSCGSCGTCASCGSCPSCGDGCCPCDPSCLDGLASI